MVRGLLIEIKDWRTGERAGGINPRDPNLRAIGGSLWQSLDHEPKGDWEIRLVLDNRDLSGYEGKIILDDGSEVYHVTDIPQDATIVDVDGVIVLNSKDEINAVVDHLPEKYRFAVPITDLNQIIQQYSLDLTVDTSKAKRGHKRTAEKRKKPLEVILEGEVSYRVLDRLHKKNSRIVYAVRKPKL